MVYVSATIETTIHFFLSFKIYWKRRSATFFEDSIQGKFPDDSYVFDVYINKGNHRVWLIDFNPFFTTTDGLLFDWSWLASATSELFTFKLVEKSDASTSLQPMYSTNRFPKDAIDLSNGQSIEEFAAKFEETLLSSQFSN